MHAAGRGAYREARGKAVLQVREDTAHSMSIIHTFLFLFFLFVIRFRLSARPLTAVRQPSRVSQIEKTKHLLVLRERAPGSSAARALDRAGERGLCAGGCAHCRCRWEAALGSGLA